MKELSIEEKAQAYDEVLNKLRRFMTQGVDPLITRTDVQDFFPELKESEDEKLRKEMLQIAKESEDSFYMILTPNKRETLITWLEKQGEQKPADKVESKFKVGDWVIDKQGIVHQVANVVENVTYHTYGYDIVGGGYFNDNNEDVRLWTIDDAKDGDVLCYKDEISLYKHDIKNCTKQETTFGGFVYHCCYDGKRFITDSLYSLTEQDKMYIHPATKEQRDLLFSKMKEAGYEWDAEKKELKKIEQKSTDEEMKEALRTEYEKGRADTIAKMRNLAWSEEDEGHIDSLLKRLEGICKSGSTFISTRFAISEDEDWLKSLRPQNRWKPSDEQIVALENTLKYFRMLNAFGETIDGLKELEEQLKKLREE